LIITAEFPTTLVFAKVKCILIVEKADAKLDEAAAPDPPGDPVHVPLIGVARPNLGPPK